MRKHLSILILLSVLILPSACMNKNTVGPLPPGPGSLCKHKTVTPTWTPAEMAPTATPTCTRTPSWTPTPLVTPVPTDSPAPSPASDCGSGGSTCGYISVSVPTPAAPYPTFTPQPTDAPVYTPTPYSTLPARPPGETYVIRSLADWEAYYGSSPAPAPPVDLDTQMLIINVEMHYAPGWCSKTHTDVIVQDVCRDGNQVTICCQLIPTCFGYGYGIPVTISITPGATPTFVFPTPVPPPMLCHVTAVAVPKSDLPVVWKVIGIIPIACCN